MDNLSKPELLTLLSIMEGELEARDLVIEALSVSHHTSTLTYFFHLSHRLVQSIPFPSDCLRSVPAAEAINLNYDPEPCLHLL